VMRGVSGLCGSRFGRGTVIPGGVAAIPDTGGLGLRLDPLERAIVADTAALLGTSSFLDRLRGAGPPAAAPPPRPRAQRPPPPRRPPARPAPTTDTVTVSWRGRPLSSRPRRARATR